MEWSHFLLSTRNRDTLGTSKDNTEQCLNRIVWESENKELISQAVRSVHIHEQIDYATRLIETDVNLALKQFNACMIDAAQCMGTKTYLETETSEKSWFDYVDFFLCRRKTNSS